MSGPDSALKFGQVRLPRENIMMSTKLLVVTEKLIYCVQSVQKRDDHALRAPRQHHPAQVAQGLRATHRPHNLCLTTMFWTFCVISSTLLLPPFFDCHSFSDTFSDLERIESVSILLLTFTDSLNNTIQMEVANNAYDDIKSKVQLSE